MNTGEAALLLSAATAWYLTGLIWFVQRVNYPLMREVGDDAFVAYENRHVARPVR